MPRISAHCLVKNEARFVWYSLTSVVNWVDRVRIVDTGSTDNTVKIIDKFIEEYKGPTEIIFDKFVPTEKFNEKKFRDKMFIQDASSDDIDWILIVDGDEIWWEASIKKVTETIREKNNKIESIIVPVCNLIGDMFHFQENVAGKYNFKGLPKGHYNLRAYNKNIPGLNSKGEYGNFGWFDGNNNMIQDRNSSKVLFLDTPYLHATHLQRSSKISKDLEVIQRTKKYKHEIGNLFPRDYYYPEAFLKSRPDIVPNVWKTMDSSFKLRSYLETPFRKLKRRIKLIN